MRAIEPVRITEGNFAAFGRYYDLNGADGARRPGARAFVSREQISAEPLKIGATAVKGGPFVSSRMERHVLSEELLICGDGGMVLTVADSDPEREPLSGDVRAFIMNPGDAVVLNKGIWHDANHGLYGDTTYFFLIPQRDFVASEVRWTDVVPGAVPVEWKYAGSGEAVKSGGTAELGEPAEAGEAENSWNQRTKETFAPYGSLTRVLEGPGLAGDTGWRSWLEEAPALAEGCHLGVGFPEQDWGDNAMECDPGAARQILCACGAVRLAVMLRGQPRSARTVTLAQGDYARLEKNVCYRVLGEPGRPGYYYTLSPHGDAPERVPVGEALRDSLQRAK